MSHAVVIFNQTGNQESASMKLKRIFLPVLVGICIPIFSLHAASLLQPGSYVTENGWGMLSLQQFGDGISFVITSTGANGHVCELKGRIKENRALLAAVDKGKPCVVHFVSLSEGIKVESVDEQSCRYFCGAQAYFDGVYLRPAAGCSPDEVQKKRAGFKQQFDKKSFAEAQAILQPVLENCQKTLDVFEQAWIRNDLALTVYRQGKAAECLLLLDPLRKLAQMTATQIAEEYLPYEAELFQPIAKASHTNLALCSKK